MVVSGRKTKKTHESINTLGYKTVLRSSKGDVAIEDSKVKDEDQSVDQTSMDKSSTENLAEGNLTIKNPKIQDKGQTIMETGPTEISAEVHVTRNGKKKRKRAKINVEVQREVDTRSTENLAEGNVIIKKPKVQDDVRRMDQSEKDTGPTENSAEVHVSRKRKKKQKSKPKTNVEIQKEVDTRSMGSCAEESVTIEKPKNSAEVRVTRKSKKKRKSEAEINIGVQREVNTGSTKNSAEGGVTIEKSKIREDAQNIGQTNIYTEKLTEGNVMIIKDPKIQDDVQSMNQNEMETSPIGSFAEGCVTGKRKKKRKGRAKIKDEENFAPGNAINENLAEGSFTIENPKIQDEAQSMGLTKMETGPAENSAEGKTRKRKKKPKRNIQIKDEVKSVVDTKPTEKLAEGNGTSENPNIQDEAQSIGQTKMETGPAENSAEGKNGKNERKPKRKKQIKDGVKSAVGTKPTEELAEGNVTIENPEVQGEAQSTDRTKMEAGLTENSAKENTNRRKKRKQNLKKKAKRKDESPRKLDTGSTENLPEDGTIKLDDKLIGDCISTCEALGGPMELEGKNFSCENHEICHPHQKGKSENGLSEVCNEIITPIRRKLLVLDVNGLLADIVYSAPNHCRGDTRIFGRAVFKRPFCDDFLKFCFQNFDVGIWSSRSKKIIEPVVNYLLGDQKDKLQFCWDMDHATKTRFNTLENKHKPLVCKELRKIWGNDEWKEDYDETNTLLLDDSPYKALLNPLHTAIFPNPYQYDNENDDSLGPGGNLRVYLEGLVTAENVQKYIEQHPFGQRPITKEHCSWEFYSKVLHQISNAAEGTPSMPNPAEGTPSMPSPEEGTASTPNAVEGTPNLKVKDVKWVKARQSGFFKPKKERASATFMWPI